MAFPKAIILRRGYPTNSALVRWPPSVGGHGPKAMLVDQRTVVGFSFVECVSPAP